VARSLELLSFVGFRKDQKLKKRSMRRRSRQPNSSRSSTRSACGNRGILSAQSILRYYSKGASTKMVIYTWVRLAQAQDLLRELFLWLNFWCEIMLACSRVSWHCRNDVPYRACHQVSISIVRFDCSARGHKKSFCLAFGRSSHGHSKRTLCIGLTRRVTCLAARGLR